MKPHVCAGCGELRPDWDAEVAQKDQVILDQANRISNLQGQLRKERNAKAKKPENDPYYPEACEVFEYWKRCLSPKAREFTGDRLVKVLARLHAGASVDEIKKAIDGCAKMQYVGENGRQPTGKKSDRHVELGASTGFSICRDESTLMRFIGYAEDEEPQQTKPAPISRERLALMQQAMQAPVIERLRALRGWTEEAVKDMELGIDRDRVVFPVRDHEGRLVGISRYQPNPERRDRNRGRPKMLAEGERNLFPAPEVVTAKAVWLTEGEPDAVALRSIDLPAVAIPGVGKWRDSWAERFAKFDKVYVIFDCDDEGREAAAKRLADLASYAEVKVIDLDPSRDDKYDVGDMLIQEGEEKTSIKLNALVLDPNVGSHVKPIRSKVTTPEEPRERPFDLVTQTLERLDCRVQHKQPGHATAQCPCHDDRVPSMAISEGRDGRVLFHCHTGCEPDAIVEALGLTWKELFAA